MSTNILRVTRYVLVVLVLLTALPVTASQPVPAAAPALAALPVAGPPVPGAPPDLPRSPSSGGSAAEGDLPRSAAEGGPATPPVTPAPAAGQAAASPAAACPRPHCLFLPVVDGPAGWLAIQDRATVRAYYLGQYLSSENVPAGWTGNQAACSAGTTAAAFRDAILRRINYFRAMAGVPALVGLSAVYSAKGQAAALMMSANRQLSHTPPSSWTCYTTDGAQAAGSSNLFLGAYGPGAITGYIDDPGAGNTAAGHRRWILFPPTQQMGTGDIPPANGYPSANALWVFDTFSPRPATRAAYVAWPPPGYVPYQVVFPRWSFSYPNADFSAATVSMQVGGAALAVSLAPVANGYGDNTLVWTPANAADPWPKPGQDTKYTVSIGNVLVNGQRQTFAYTVIVFDPAT